MLDESFPTYRFQPSSDNPLNTLLYFTHNGSDPTAEFLLKRPAPAASKSQYALGLLDVHYASVIYAEVLITPEWSQPTLSAAEVRANNGSLPTSPLVPEAFPVMLYNPDQTVVVKRNQGGWNKSDSWEFEIPERTFKLPSSSQIDQDGGRGSPVDLAPKLVFRWKRDGRLSRDLTCYMTGRTMGGKKSKEPDITVAMFHGAKGEGAVTIYEPNMRRVEIEDRKGLEEVLLLSAEVIRDLYLVPKHDPFNAAGMSAPVDGGGRRKNSRPTVPPSAAMVSGALQSTAPAQAGPSHGPDPRQHQAHVDAETQRVKDMVAKEDRIAREREKRDQEEQRRIKKMLEQEDKERRKRDAAVDKETERLRREYGVQPPQQPPNNAGAPPGGLSPALPPRHTQGSWFGPPTGYAPPTRPVSVGPPSTGPRVQFAPPPAQAQEGGKKKHGNGLLGHGPYSGPGAASVSGFFGRDGGKKVQKKRSLQF